MLGWRASNAGPNQTVSGGLETLRKRSRDVCRNSATANAAINTFVRSLVGFGISARPTTDDAAIKSKLNGLWAAWCKVADADGADFTALQQLAVRAWLESGEVFIRLRPRRIEDGLPVPMQCQVIEGDCLPLHDVDQFPGLPEGNVIRQGIELDKLGRRVAYWFLRNHPEDTPLEALSSVNDVRRVPAEQVVHLYEPTRPGQLRGVPLLAPVLAKLRAIDDLNDAVLTRQQLANLFTLFVTKALPSGAADVMTGLPYEGSLDNPLSGLEPGSTMELLPGEDVKFSTPPDAGANYADYIRSQLLALSSGLGLPYEFLTGDLKDVSDRSLRIGVNEFRRGCEAKIWGVIVPRFLDKVRASWAMFAFIGGALTQSEADAALAVVWAPQAWPYMHPTQDIQARKMEVDAGFRSRASVIAERGDDPEMVDQERADDKQRAANLGLQSPEDKLADAELKKLIAEADAAQRTADAAKAKAGAARAAMTEAHARTETVEATRPHQLATAQATAKAAKVELQAAELGLAELKGAKK
jgi:lambda family phage portal protein